MTLSQKVKGLTEDMWLHCEPKKSQCYFPNNHCERNTPFSTFCITYFRNNPFQIVYNGQGRVPFCAFADCFVILVFFNVMPKLPTW